MKVANKIKKLLCYVPGILALMLFVVYGLGDYWDIGVVADPEEIERYNFGAEAMIAHGGEKYRSASTYAAASLAVGVLSTVGLVASLFFLFSSSGKSLLKAYCCTGISLLVVILVGHVW